LAGILTVVLGGSRPGEEQLASWTGIPATFLFVLLVPLLGPWDEPGFRGFALSRLRVRFSSLSAGLLVILILAASVVFAWFVAGSNTVFLAMVMQATNNAVSGEYVCLLFDGADAALLGWIRAGLW
jgi:hypothetical protein